MSTSKKVTYSLPPDLVLGIKDAVRRGEAGSSSAFVRDAVTAYLVRAREARLRRAYSDAATDPDFVRDNEAVMKDFEHVDAERLQDRSSDRPTG